MTKYEIVEALAKGRKVEQMIENIAHQALSANLKDLAQMVYVILLEYDEKKLQDLWEKNQINFFLARIIVNQYCSSNSPYYTTFRKMERMVDESVTLFHPGHCDFDEFNMLDTYRVIHDED